MKNRLFSLILLLSCLCSSSLRAQGVSADLPAHSSVYQYMDVLAAYGLLPSAIMGQRPYAKQEIQRMLVEAKRNFQHQEAGLESKSFFLTQIFYHLEKELDEEGTRWLKLREAEFQVVQNSEEPREYPLETQNFMGGTVHPLSRNQNGVTFPDGGSFFLKTQHVFPVSSFTVFQAAPRLQLQALDNGNTNLRIHLDQAAVKLGAWNLELGVGRQQQIWGQAHSGGLAFSNNARAIDMIRFKNVSPVHLPVLGEFMGTFFYGTLGPEQNYAHTQMTGFKLSVKPSPLVELGGSSITIFGGEGAPDFSFTQGLREWFGFIPVVSQTSQQFSNRILFFDSRVTLPFLRYSSIYGEWAIEDRARWNRLKKTFFNDSAYLVGFFVPRLSADGRWQARFEAKYFGPIAYRHDLFRDGYSINGKIIGDALGLDAHSYAVELAYYFSPQTVLRSAVELQSYDDNGYAGHDFDIVRDGSVERRYLLVSNLRFPLAKTVFAKPELKYEYIDSFNFQPGSNKHFAWFAFNLQKSFD